MFSNALRTSIQVVKARPVVPVRTIITCTRYNRYSPVESIKHQHVMVQKRTFMGPLIRYMTQFLASIGGTSIRAFFQAFQQAAGNEFYAFIDLQLKLKEKRMDNLLLNLNILYRKVCPFLKLYKL